MKKIRSLSANWTSMRTLIFLILTMLSISGHAACGGQMAFIETEKVSIIIGEDGCEAGTKMMISFSIMKKNGKFGKPVVLPFLSECVPTKDGFKCRPNGKSPLAGATYKNIKFGRSNSGCANEGDLGSKFICVKGCEDLRLPAESQIIPEYLVGNDTSC